MNKQIGNRQHYSLFILTGILLLLYFNAPAQTKEIVIDRFYKTVDSILDCRKKYDYTDTMSFIQKALNSYKYNEVTFRFDTFFKCHESAYTNEYTANGKKPDASIPTVVIASMYADCDKKYILLFYIDTYLFGNILRKHSVPNDLNVHSTIRLTNIKSGKRIEMSDKSDFKFTEDLYKRLLKTIADKKLLRQILYEKKISPLEYLGYKWEFS